MNRRALSVARHHHTVLEQAVADAIAWFRPDVIHAEQLQALANCSAAKTAGIPIVLRMQNVESEIWRQTGAARLRALPFLFEAKRLRTEEKRALSHATQTVCLTEPDAHQLRDIGGDIERGKIRTIAPAFPSQLSAGPRLHGEPAIVLSGSAGWWPNTQATRWFLRKVAPSLQSILPRAIVHVFGGDDEFRGANIATHMAPAESIVSFPEGAIAVVPLFVGSGIRMRILEAWARGIPVVATSRAVVGLDVISGRELLVADTPADFCAALQLLASSPNARTEMIAAGRAYLRTRHDSAQTTRELLDVYRQAMASA